MHLGSWESTREAFEWHEAKPSASLASRVLSQLPKCIHNSIDAQLNHGPLLLEHCHLKRKLMKYRILQNHSERFDWLNAITRFDREYVYRDLDARSCHTKSARKLNWQRCSDSSYTRCQHNTFRKRISSSVLTAKGELTPAIVSLGKLTTSREVDVDH